MYERPIKFKAGYKNGIYLMEEEYTTTNNDVKILAAKRNYVINYLIDNLKMNNVTLRDGINNWRMAFYHLRTIFLVTLRDKLADKQQNIMNIRITDNNRSEFANRALGQRRINEGDFNKSSRPGIFEPDWDYMIKRDIIELGGSQTNKEYMQLYNIVIEEDEHRTGSGAQARYDPKVPIRLFRPRLFIIN